MDKKRKRRTISFRRAFLFSMEILLVVFLAYGLTVSFARKTEIREESMAPTLSAGQSFLINSLSYRMGSPARGDIIAFRVSEDEEVGLHIKRVIGLPGETIQIVDGQIRIDGKAYMEQGNFPAIIHAGQAEDEIVLDSDEYFVLGDNRNGSEDSRFADVGNIRRRDIVGKIWLRVEPFGDFGPVG